jgi:2-methylcitrate dehydratase PrpD
MGSIEAPANDHTLTSKANGHQTPAATSTLSDFVANAFKRKQDYLTPTVIGRLKEFILDYIGVTLAAAQSSESTPSFLAAVKALGGETTSSQGKSCTVLGIKQRYTPQYAGFLNAAFGHSLDFDDTYAKGTLHAGVTAIAAALAEAEVLGDKVTIEDVLLSIAIGYEITCRLGALLGNEAYARGFHNTSTAGIFGAVATISVLRGLSSQTVENAFGLAGSKAAGSMQYLENGSWNKRLHPGFAVHDAFICVALSEAGVLGAAKIIEGKMGFLNAYSPKENKDLHWLVGELGSRWEFLETGLKPFPACRMTHGFIEHACRLGRDRGITKASQVKSITLSLSPENVLVVGATLPNKIHPENMVDAQFSAYFTMAHSFLYGSDGGVRAYQKDRLADTELRALSDKITCVGDKSIKEFGSKINVEYADGDKKELNIPFPLGEEEHPFVMEQVEKKFFGLATPVLSKTSISVRDAVANIEQHTVADLLALLH